MPKKPRKKITKKEIKNSVKDLVKKIKSSKWNGTIIIDRDGYSMCDIKLDVTVKFPKGK